MGAAQKAPAPLPAKLAGLLREAKWLALVAAAAYLLLIFATFDRADPGWSHSATDATVRNAGGVVGAWIADLLLYLFGVSAYWLIALCAYVVVWGYRRLDGSARRRFPGRGWPTSNRMDWRPAPRPRAPAALVPKVYRGRTAGPGSRRCGRSCSW